MEDILDDRRTKGDLRWILQQCNVQQPFCPKLLEPTLLECVRQNPGVQAELFKMSPAERLEAHQQINDIFLEMNHCFGVGAIRRIGFLLAKIFKQLYDHINVEIEGIEQVRALPAGVPTLYLPTHRSYVDFLLVSYVCFHYQLPMPVIAAGMDFKSMLWVGEMLRSCGAFFIRRRLAGDRLYAAVLRAYVQSLMLTNPQPAEFFIEGTRSRSGKPLPPRTGLLASYLELLDAGQIPDINIVPISISYDRVIEESLYAYEMLGTPKPPESTGRLVRAVSVLAENYGSVHVRVHGVRSARRGPAGCRPLAADVLRCQVAGGRLGAGALLLTALQLAGGRAPLARLVAAAEHVRLRLAAAQPALLLEEADDGAVRRALHVHHRLMRVTSGRLVELRPLDQPPSGLQLHSKGPRLSQKTLDEVVPRIHLQFYVNPVLPHIAESAIAYLAADTGRPDAHRLLLELMTVEFPTLEGRPPEAQLAPTDTRWREVTSQLVRPYLEAYRTIIGIVMDALPGDVPPARIQSLAEQRCPLRHPATHLCLCKLVIGNCVTALLKMQAGRRTSVADDCGATAITWRGDRLAEIRGALDALGPTPPPVCSKL